MKAPIFQGSCVAIVTPYTERGIDFAKLEELLDFQAENGTAAICVCGTTGEAATMTAAEQLDAIAHTVRYVNHRMTVIAGTGSNNTAHAIESSIGAAKAGADALLLVTPYYNKCSQSGLVQHYNAIVEAARLPAIVYNVPGRTGVSMTLNTYIELSKNPLINGVKEASGNISLAARTIQACGDRFNVWSGNDDQIVPLMSVGAKGIISVLANICPKEVAQIARLCLDNNFAAAGKLQCQYMELIDALFCEVNPIPVKTALNVLGRNVGRLRMPLSEMAPQNLETLKTALRNFGFQF